MHRDWYINAIDMRGIPMAHGKKKAMIGKNPITLKDAAGNRFIQKFMHAANSKSSG